MGLVEVSFDINQVSAIIHQSIQTILNYVFIEKMRCYTINHLHHPLLNIKPYADVTQDNQPTEQQKM